MSDCEGKREQNLIQTVALRAMMSLMLHWEMQGGHRSGRKKAENDTEAEKND